MRDAAYYCCSAADAMPSVAFVHFRTLHPGEVAFSPGRGCSHGTGGELVRSADDKMKKPPKSDGGKETGRPGRNVGQALRQAYDEALSEAVPDDLLDLLKKLD